MNKTLQNAVIRRLGGRESLQDICNHGADGGYHGFIYYDDTCKFFRAHKLAIIELAEELAEDLGENVLELIKNFNCLHGEYSTAEIAKVLYGRWDNNSNYHTQIANAMAWFALEEVARYICDK